MHVEEVIIINISTIIGISIKKPWYGPFFVNQKVECPCIIWYLSQTSFYSGLIMF